MKVYFISNKTLQSWGWGKGDLKERWSSVRTITYSDVAWGMHGFQGKGDNISVHEGLKVSKRNRNLLWANGKVRNIV